MYLKQSDAAAARPLSSQRKRDLLDHYETNVDELDRWREFNAAYHEDDQKFMRFLIPPGKRVLELGCGRGDLLAALKPSYGVGIDFSAETIAKANARHPELNFVLGDVEDPATLAAIEGPFDYIVIADTIGMFEDIDGTLAAGAPVVRAVHAHHHLLLLPSVGAGPEARRSCCICAAGSRRSTTSPPPISCNLMDLADFEMISQEQRQLLPRRCSASGRSSIATSRRCRVSGSCACAPISSAARSGSFPDRKFSASILIPCRNERGNIENAILRMPRFGCAQEIMFVEGNSSDGTFEECERVRDAYKGQWDIKVLKQDGKGKGDAVRKGFAAATGDVLMILDADLTMPPEALPKYHAVIESGKAEFVNGTRLIYPMEDEAMRPLNLIANRCFAYLFSYLVNTRLTDTLCGTKVLLRKDYEVLARERAYFGNFDPFGDFDLIFGAAKQNLKIIETPIHYKARTFGETQISRFRDGWLLLKMVWFAYRKLKAV